MAQQSVMQSSKPQSKNLENEEIEADEIQIPQRRSVYDSVNELAEKFAATNVGQFIAERGDRTLKVIEYTAKWSLPQDQSECNLERPLPWLPFLALIIVLRLVRVWLSIAAMLIGNGPVTPQNMVYFIQTRRRKLRAVRVHGAKAIRRRELEVCTYKTTSPSEGKGLLYKLRNLFGLAICRPGKQRSNDLHTFTKQAKDMEQSTATDRQSAKRARDDSLNDHNLTIDQMLAKYADEDSDDDSDFIPNPAEETNDDEASSSCSSDDSAADSEAEENEGIEIVENGIKRAGMPKPLREIKMELQSDADSMNDEASTPKESKKQMGNGVERQQSEATANKTTHAANGTNNRTPNLTNGHEQKQGTKANGSEAGTITKQSLVLNNAATAGSPTNFNEYFATYTNDTSSATATSTPTLTPAPAPAATPAAEIESYDSFGPQPITTAQQHQQQLPMYQKQQSYYHNQRYRGKNRRY